MANKTVVEEKEEKEAEKEIIVHSLCEYDLKYRSRGITQHLLFKFSGDRTAAIERARLYCQNMRLLFIYVDDMYINLDEHEQRMLQRDNG